MATIKVNGSAAVITSTLKLEDVQLIKKYKPEALTLMGGKDGNEPIFAIGVSPKGAGSINKLGAVFDAQSFSEEGFATVTLVLGAVDGDVKEAIADAIGQPVGLLGQLEEKISGVAEEIKAERKKFMDGIALS